MTTIMCLRLGRARLWSIIGSPRIAAVFSIICILGCDSATIAHNDISLETSGDYPASPYSFGVEIISIQDSVGVTVVDNNVTNCAYGVLLTGDSTTAGITISGGTLVGNTYGVCVTDADRSSPVTGTRPVPSLAA